MYPYAVAPAPANTDNASSLVLCLVVFLVVMLLFRGVQNRRTCAAYTQEDVPVTSYVELPQRSSVARSSGASPELGSPSTAAYSSY